jgi:hypothetical protein
MTANYNGPRVPDEVLPSVLWAGDREVEAYRWKEIESFNILKEFWQGPRANR